MPGGWADRTPPHDEDIRGADRGPRPRLLARASDEMLAREVQLGNEAAFQVIYDRHAAGLRRMCRRMLQSPEDAEDALQQSLARAWAAMRRAEGEPPRQLRPWLFALTRNRCLSVLGGRAPDTIALEDQDHPAPATCADEVERRAELRSVLADVGRLPDHQRQALVLTQLGGLSHAATAARLGRHKPTIKSLVFEARATLSVWRDARDTPCDEIRAQLSSPQGGTPGRRALHRHLELCENCRAMYSADRAQAPPAGARRPGPALGGQVLAE